MQTLFNLMPSASNAEADAQSSRNSNLSHIDMQKKFHGKHPQGRSLHSSLPPLEEVPLVYLIFSWGNYLKDLRYAPAQQN
jgi:hypothetical protein